MNCLFDIKRSEKSFLDNKEKYIVVYENQVMLRVLGEEGSYEVMTATVGEDYGDILSYSDKGVLIEAALSLTEILGADLRPEKKHDYNSRAYVLICTCEYLSDVHRLTELLIKTIRCKQAIE